MNKTNYYALIPAYKPEYVLINFVKQLKANGFIVIIVDDGSPEKYSSVFDEAKQYGTVLSYETNQGKGYALKTGLSYMKNNCEKGSIVVTMDADGQHSIKDAIRICSESERYPDSLITGGRQLKKDTPTRSKIGNAATRFVFRLLTGVKVYDTQTGLRAFNTDMIPFMSDVEGNRYEYEMNVLLSCAKAHIPIREIKIETIYIDGNSGSHFNAIKDSLRIYAEILKFALSSFVGFLTDYIMYAILVLLTSGLGTGLSIPISNVLARIISATINYTINRKLIFKSKDNVVKTTAMYFFLAALILAGNTLILYCMIEYLDFNRFWAKIITEFMFFALSWIVQKYIIFRKK